MNKKDYWKKYVIINENYGVSKCAFCDGLCQEYIKILNSKKRWHYLESNFEVMCEQCWYQGEGKEYDK